MKERYLGMIIKPLASGYRVPHLGGRVFRTKAGAQAAIRSRRRYQGKRIP